MSALTSIATAAAAPAPAPLLVGVAGRSGRCRWRAAASDQGMSGLQPSRLFGAVFLQKEEGAHLKEGGEGHLRRDVGDHGMKLTVEPPE